MSHYARVPLDSLLTLDMNGVSAAQVLLSLMSWPHPMMKNLMLMILNIRILLGLIGLEVLKSYTTLGQRIKAWNCMRKNAFLKAYRKKIITTARDSIVWNK